MISIRSLLAQNMRRARKQLRISQMELAERCQLSPSYVGEIELERKYPSAESLQKIADGLHMRPYQLFLEQEDVGWDILEGGDQTRFRRELKQKIDQALHETFRKYLS